MRRPKRKTSTSAAPVSSSSSSSSSSTTTTTTTSAPVASAAAGTAVASAAATAAPAAAAAPAAPAAAAPPRKKRRASESRKNHRVACHRCGNLRSYTVLCAVCPQTFCRMCAKKMVAEHGVTAFEGGCPKCKGMCCCRTRSLHCTRKHHCYKKCPTTKASSAALLSSKKKDEKKSPKHVDLVTLYAQVEEFLVHSHEYTFPAGWGGEAVEKIEIIEAV